jgi:hypothetical protein
LPLGALLVDDTCGCGCRIAQIVEFIEGMMKNKERMVVKIQDEDQFKDYFS